jgi:hypothetical protein
VGEALAGLEWTEPLAPLVQVALQLPRRDSEAVASLRRLHDERWADTEDRPLLVQIRQDVEAAGEGPPSRLPDRAPRSGLDPESVFRLLCDARGEVADTELLTAFRSLLQADA